MKDITFRRQIQIRRDYVDLRANGITRLDAFDELGKKYYLATETIRLIIYGAGGYIPPSEINMPKV